MTNKTNNENDDEREHARSSSHTHTRLISPVLALVCAARKSHNPCPPPSFSPESVVINSFRTDPPIISPDKHPLRPPSHRKSIPPTPHPQFLVCMFSPRTVNIAVIQTHTHLNTQAWPPLLSLYSCHSFHRRGVDDFATAVTAATVIDRQLLEL